MLNYLLAPTFQYINTAGRPLSGGAYLEVYIHGTRDKYYCASDFEGNLHPFQIPLDSLGANVVLAEDTGSYDVYAYNRYGSLIMSRYNVKPGAGGGSGMGTITSSDGSIEVTPTSTGVDLKVNGQEPSVLRATADDLDADGSYTFSALVIDGTELSVDENGRIRMEDGWYHYDATVRLVWEDSVNDSATVQLYTTLNSDVMEFDLSYAHDETVQLGGEMKITTGGTSFVLGVSGLPSGMVAQLVDLGIHTITGHGDAAGYEAGDGIVIDDHEISVDPTYVQEKLTAGDNIQISEENVISATDTTYTAGTGLDLDGTEFSVDTSEIQEKLTAGSNIVIEGNTISATAEPQLQANWAEDDSSSVQYIQNKPQNLVQDPDYVHTDNNFTDAEQSKLAGIEAGAEANVQSDWTESNTASDAYIQHKPSVKPVAAGDNITITEGNDAFTISATDTTYTAGQNITITNNVISATAEPQLQSNWTENDNTSVQYIQNKPSEKSLVAGNNITFEVTSNTMTISATVPAQQQADWSEADTTAADYIKNKPNLALKEDVANKKQSIDATSTTDYASSKAVADYVNNAVSTATANFLGNYTLTDLSLTYPVTTSQIETALDGYTFSTTPTKNDYVYVEIQNPQTTGIDDEVQRYKFNGTSWLYEYTLNNSSFSVAEKAAIDSGINSTKVNNYDTHIADTTIHVTAADKTAWNGKQDAISDLNNIRTGAGLGATSVQDVTVDGVSVVSNGTAAITMPAESTVVAGSNITITEANSTITIAATVPVIGTITM